MDFNQGKVYKIINDNYDKYYIGSTCKSLDERLYHHKNNFSNFKKGTYKSNVSVFRLFEIEGNISIELIELYPCNSFKDLLIKEQYYMNLFRNDIININNAIGKTPDETIIYRDNYYNHNKDIKSIQQICEICQGSYNYYCKSRHYKSTKHLSKIL